MRAKAAKQRKKGAKQETVEAPFSYSGKHIKPERITTTMPEPFNLDPIKDTPF